MGDDRPSVNGRLTPPQSEVYPGPWRIMTRGPPPSRAEVARRRGRRVAVALFALVVGGATAVWSWQILWQVWGPGPPREPVECRAGLLDLLGAVRRARLAAAAETGGERAALARFRHALEPEWTQRPTLESSCASDLQLRKALGDIDRLRYAEEHAVRYEAVDLARGRRRAQAIERELSRIDRPE